MATSSTAHNEPHQPVTSARNATRDISAWFGRRDAARQAGSTNVADNSRVHIGRLLEPALCCADHGDDLSQGPDSRFDRMGQPILLFGTGALMRAPAVRTGVARLFCPRATPTRCSRTRFGTSARTR